MNDFEKIKNPEIREELESFSSENEKEGNPDTYIQDPDKAFFMYDASKEALNFALHFEKQAKKEGDQDILGMAQKWKEEAEKIAEEEGENWEKRNERVLKIVDEIFKDILSEVQRVKDGSNSIFFDISAEIKRIILNTNPHDSSKIYSESLGKFKIFLAAEKEPYKIEEKENIKNYDQTIRKEYFKSDILNNIDLVEVSKVGKHDNEQNIISKVTKVRIYNDKDLEDILKERKEYYEIKKGLEGKKKLEESGSSEENIGDENDDENNLTEKE